MIRELKKSDINGLNRLPPADWGLDYEMFLRDFMKEDFFSAFVMTQEEKIIGTGNVFLKEKIGWLANIIIDEQYRGRGLGFKMTKFLVDFLNSKGCETQLLIATKLGEPIYQKVGFKKITDYECFETVVEKNCNYPDSIRELKYSDLKDLHELDKEANAEDRAHLLDKFHKNGLGYFNDDKELLGVYLPGFGRGLVLARNQKAGIELLKIKHSKNGSRTLLPIDNLDGIRFFEQNGSKKGDRCSRMILGKDNKWNPRYIYSYGSGYCG